MGFPVRLLIGAALLLAVSAASTLALRSPQLTMDAGARLAVALAPVPVAVWVIVEYVRVVRRADEFARRVLLESLAIAYPVAMLLGLTVEYLQKGGFLPGVNVGRVWPFQALMWVVAYAYAHWRYR